MDLFNPEMLLQGELSIFENFMVFVLRPVITHMYADSGLKET